MKMIEKENFFHNFRYYLFYQFVAGDKSKHSALQQDVTNQVSQMWQEMSEDDKDTFIAMAALEGSQSDSNLSDDLRELEVEPIHKGMVINSSSFKLLDNM